MVNKVLHAELNGIPWNGISEIEIIVPKTCEHCEHSVIFENKDIHKKICYCNLFNAFIKPNNICCYHEYAGDQLLD